ncbi:protein of unknown function [Candidatus Nitrotoga arctica]|uniref:Uncharacterized protein n=1 Tax=Candidatus Nitrotoga arctica TaxID=453162 RepID=A0ABM8YXW1_9PROT|nr:protein of unknown function [Candidatus Nitrotoga arctica]
MPLRVELLCNYEGSITEGSLRERQFGAGKRVRPENLSLSGLYYVFATPLWKIFRPLV